MCPAGWRSHKVAARRGTAPVALAWRWPEANARPWLAWPRAGRGCSPPHLAGDRTWCTSIAASTPWLARYRCSNRESILRPLATNSRPCEGCCWRAKDIRFRTASVTPLQRGWAFGNGHSAVLASPLGSRYRYRVSGIGYRVSGIGYRVSGVGNLVSGSRYSPSRRGHARWACRVAAPACWKYSRMPHVHASKPSRSRQHLGVPQNVLRETASETARTPGALAKDVARQTTRLVPTGRRTANGPARAYGTSRGKQPGARQWHVARQTTRRAAQRQGAANKRASQQGKLRSK